VLAQNLQHAITEIGSGGSGGDDNAVLAAEAAATTAAAVATAMASPALLRAFLCDLRADISARIAADDDFAAGGATRFPTLAARVPLLTGDADIDVVDDDDVDVDDDVEMDESGSGGGAADLD
jgi:hypothetical protein